MNKRNLFAASLRVIAGLMDVAAIITQLTNSLEHGRSIANFFSFFTIESNMLAAAVLLIVGAYQLLRKTGRQIAFVRGGATLFMTMTGVIYILLLSGNTIALQTTIPWVNLVLHYILPVYVLADWLLFPPKQYVAPKKAQLWLLFPLAYLFYSLARGAITGWYPYPFLDPIVTGWPQVAVTCIFIAGGASILAWLLALRTSGNKKLPAM